MVAGFDSGGDRRDGLNLHLHTGTTLMFHLFDIKESKGNFLIFFYDAINQKTPSAAIKN